MPIQYFVLNHKGPRSIGVHLICISVNFKWNVLTIFYVKKLFRVIAAQMAPHYSYWRNLKIKAADTQEHASKHFDQ